MFFKLHLPWQWVHSSLQLLIQSWICAPGTHYSWVDRDSVEYKVCPTLLHMASIGNQTPYLLILNPMPYPLGHILPQYSLNTCMVACGWVVRALRHIIRRSGVRFPFLLMCRKETSGKFHIPHCLSSPSHNGYLVHRSKVGSIVVSCCGC